MAQLPGRLPYHWMGRLAAETFQFCLVELPKSTQSIEAEPRCLALLRLVASWQTD